MNDSETLFDYSTDIREDGGVLASTYGLKLKLHVEVDRLASLIADQKQ